MRIVCSDIGDDDMQRREWELLGERRKKKEKSTNVKEDLSGFVLRLVS
jgi:hypothetical protein